MVAGFGGTTERKGHASGCVQPGAGCAWGWEGHQTIFGDGTAGDGVHAQAALDLYVKSALGTTEAAGVATLAVSDLATHALLEGSAEAALLVLGGRGMGGFHGLMVGSVSQQCLHHATCPVVIVRQGSATPADVHQERIVVGIDSWARYARMVTAICGHQRNRRSWRTKRPRERVRCDPRWPRIPRRRTQDRSVATEGTGCRRGRR